MSRCEKASAVEDQNCGPAALLSAGGCKYDDVTQVSKPAVSPTSQSSDRPLSGRLRIWKSARQQVWKPALQNTSPNLRPGALRPSEGGLVVCGGRVKTDDSGHAARREISAVGQRDTAHCVLKQPIQNP